MPALQDLLPRTFELIGVRKIVKQLCAIEVGAAVDKTGVDG
jgi:hypothetical protein